MAADVDAPAGSRRWESEAHRQPSLGVSEFFHLLLKVPAVHRSSARQCDPQ